MTILSVVEAINLQARRNIELEKHGYKIPDLSDAMSEVNKTIKAVKSGQCDNDSPCIEDSLLDLWRIYFSCVGKKRNMASIVKYAVSKINEGSNVSINDSLLDTGTFLMLLRGYIRMKDLKNIPIILQEIGAFNNISFDQILKRFKS